MHSNACMKILFFAMLRELTGSDSLDWELDQPITVEILWGQILEKFPGLLEFKAPVLFAINQEYARAGSVVRNEDELAIFPPVSGGAPSPEEGYAPNLQGDIFTIVHAPIQSEGLSQQLARPEDGAIVVFEGIVRNQSQSRGTLFLEYEGYEPMALIKLREIGALLHERWDIGKVGIVHRLGRLEIGEASVVIVITAPHRAAAFKACSYAIDTLKLIVPIWKKEHFEDGSVWIEGKREF
jgi:MoaE-MoaD fusion protein